MLTVMTFTILLCWVCALGGLMTYTSQSQTSVWDTKLQAIATRIMLVIPADKVGDMQDPPSVDGQIPGDVTQARLKLREDALDASEKQNSLNFQIWENGKRLIGRTPNAPATPLQPSFVDGFSSVTIDGQRWRVFSLSDSTNSVFVQVANLHSLIDREMRHEAFTALGITTALLVFVGFLMACAVRKSLEPIKDLDSAVRARHKFDLTPLPAVPLPTELQPLVASFNHLLKQLDQAIEGERRFIGDAAHELRTPLSALQAHGQIALRASTVEAKDAALVKLLAVAQRSTRLSDQLLDLARLDAGVNVSHQGTSDLSELLVYVAHEFDIHAQQNGRSISLAPEPCRIACNVDEIGILLRNLIDNALRYTTPGGRVRVSCGYGQSTGSTPGEHVFLEVADDGPGVPQSEHAHIFERFHRVPGSGGRGSGIGLSLVAGIAQLHNAVIHTGTGLDERGFRVRVQFPMPPDTER
ncbi:two-component sensor histidine kinase [Pigmentiphaga aceris]|uniref:histidine kinase n=1 Tax=Pigmentiphaga aceris TaxID=1940612 RepID=A0A5C0AUZ1_9BURK|nr:ATP-binding protein [Pigmentiphaga aceris]QEI04491.1 two-component sensor histidine kinase [Pigmentiphaga aceris]